MKTLVEEYALAIVAVVVFIALILMVAPVARRVEGVLDTEGAIKKTQVDNATYYANTSQLKEVRSVIVNDRVINDSVMINFSKVADQYKDDILALTPSSSFISPIDFSDYSISASPWRYPESFGGDVHLGADYAKAAGLDHEPNVYAPANGVVVASGDGCGAGFLGDKCKGNGENLVGAGGNQVWFMTSVNNKVYVMVFFHLLDGSVIHTGPVSQGDKIGVMGTSGNSTGTHTHIEMFYIGDGDFSDIESKYLREDHSTSYGCTWGEYALNHVCETDSQMVNGTTCRLNPLDKLPQS